MDPTTLQLLANHKSLEDLVAAHDSHSDSDYDDEEDSEDMQDDSDYSSSGEMSDGEGK